MKKNVNAACICHIIDEIIKTWNLRVLGNGTSYQDQEDYYLSIYEELLVRLSELQVILESIFKEGVTSTWPTLKNIAYYRSNIHYHCSGYRFTTLSNYSKNQSKAWAITFVQSLLASCDSETENVVSVTDTSVARPCLNFTTVDKVGLVFWFIVICLSCENSSTLVVCYFYAKKYFILINVQFSLLKRCEVPHTD